MNALPPETSRRVEFGKTLCGIRPSPRDNDAGIICDFLDGTSAGPFDMVIGCDGIKSAVKEFIDVGKISKDATRRDGDGAGIYSGIRIRYAVQDGDTTSSTSTSSSQNTDLKQYFGDGAYALKGVYGAGKGRLPVQCAFITFLDKDYVGPFKKREGTSSTKAATVVTENADWTQDVQKSLQEARQIMLQQVKDCGVPDVDLAPVISNADRFFELGVYFHNPFSFNGWSKEVPGTGGSFVVLCGDAAHAVCCLAHLMFVP